MAGWNPWHGCHKISEGCRHCYVYRMDSAHQRDSSIVCKTGDFTLPIRKDRKGNYKIPVGEMVYTCFTSDFFVEEADEWREEAWAMMRERQDLFFLMITKRIDRFHSILPKDWEDGYDNVTICCTVENQDRADYRLPIYLKAPIKHKKIICEPILEKICLTPYLNTQIEEVLVGGESGPNARICNYDWVLDIRRQCVEKRIPFTFRQTGARFQKDGKLYYVKRAFQHQQARKAGIHYPEK